MLLKNPFLELSKKKIIEDIDNLVQKETFLSDSLIDSIAGSSIKDLEDALNIKQRIQKK